MLYSLLIQAQRPLINKIYGGNYEKIHNFCISIENKSYCFSIHYADSIPLKSKLSLHNCTKTYVQHIQKYLTETANIFLNPNNSSDGIPFRSPVPDGKLGGNNNYIDFYVLNLTYYKDDSKVIAETYQDVYVTEREDSISSAYTFISNDLSYEVEPIATFLKDQKYTNKLRTAVCHEFFHHIQMAYHRTLTTPFNSWKASQALVEGTAAWAETRLELTYDNTNLAKTCEDGWHYIYLDSDNIFENQKWGLFATSYLQGYNYIKVSPLYPYSSVFFWKYVTERFFDEPTENQSCTSKVNLKPIRKIWENYSSKEYFSNEIGAYNNFFFNYQRTIRQVILEFYEDYNCYSSLININQTQSTTKSK